MDVPDVNNYQGFSDLAKYNVQGKDYRIIVLKRPSPVAIVAPHGGKIEKRTSDIAKAIAANDCNLYLFEGIRSSRNYASLHLTSHRFDEPECLALVEACPIVVTIHGFTNSDEKILIGGLDIALKEQLAIALHEFGVLTEIDGHGFPAMEPKNICNRGSTGKGVQLEFSSGIRGSDGEPRAIQAIRSVVLGAN